MLVVIWSPHGARLLESEDKSEETSIKNRRAMTGYRVGKPKTSLFCIMKLELGFCGP